MHLSWHGHDRGHMMILGNTSKCKLNVKKGKSDLVNEHGPATN